MRGRWCVRGGADAPLLHLTAASPQGFCCKCETLDDWVSASTLPRSGATCNLFSASGLGSTAHCVEYDTLRYNLFRIGPPQVDYSISVRVKHCRGQDCTETPLGVSHSSPLAVTENRDVMVRIAGDFASALSSPSLSHNFLAVPGARCKEKGSRGACLRPGAHPRSAPAKPPLRPASDINSQCARSFLPERCRSRIRVRARRPHVPQPSPHAASVPSRHRRPQDSEVNWMVLDRTLVDATGLTCNAVGVNEEAFVGQGSRCDVKAGSCLQGQIMALEKARGPQTRPPPPAATTTSHSNAMEAGSHLPAPAPAAPVPIRKPSIPC